MPLMMNCTHCPRLRFDPELVEAARKQRRFAREHCRTFGHMVTVVDREASLVYSPLGDAVLLERQRVARGA